jgi:predicted outer membrane protein
MWGAALATVLVLVSCGGRQSSSTGESAAGNAAEAEVVGQLLAISEVEVSTADIAESLLTTPDVTTLAERINMDHISVRYSVKGLPSEDSDAARALIAARDSFAVVFRATPPASGDRVFLEHELQMHARYIPMLDAMATKAEKEDVKTIVQRLREVEDLHVTAIERVLKDLPAK